MYERLGCGHPLILAGIWEEVTLQKGSSLKKNGFTRDSSLDPHSDSVLGVLANTPALCLENHGK